MSKANILLCGKTGVGKSSLIQSLTPFGTVPDSAIGNSSATTRSFDCYKAGDSEITFVDSEGLEPGQTMESFVDKISREMNQRVATQNEENLIHAIWYCVDGTNARLQAKDLEFLSQFSDKTILVVTKTDLMREVQTKNFQESLSEFVDSRRTIFVSGHSKTGFVNLLKVTREIIEESYVNAKEEIDRFNDEWERVFNGHILEAKKRCSEVADGFISWATTRAGVVAISPIPVADMPILVANEIYMICRVGNAYGYHVDKAMAMAIIGAAGASLVGKFLASFIPGVKIAVATATTYGVGKAAKAYFESGMQLDRSALREEFIRSKKEADVKKLTS